MTDNKSYDVILIGAGSIGTPTALYLAKAGIKTLVCESAASVGQGSSKKAIGGIRATHSDPAKIALCLRSIEIFSTWEQEYGDSIEWFKGGYSYPVYREEEEQKLKSLLETQKKYGLAINWLSNDELLSIIPDLNPENLRGGTFSPEDGNASPLLATHAFYQRAVEAGAEFKFNEEVSAILVEKGRVTGVETNHGSYACKYVINCAGSYAQKISQLIHVDIPVKPDSHESGISEPVEHFLNPMVVDIRPTPGSSNYYFYQHITGQIVFCITPSPNIWGFDTRETSSFLPMVAKRMVEIMPRLQNIRVRRTWRGLYPMTPDGFPIVGFQDEVEGFIQAAGMCGQGFMLGPGLAELLVRMVTDTLTEKDQMILSYLSLYRSFDGEELLK
jgi:sarcosine oxidase subunit beta